jgi:hypothetical protein
MFVYLQGVTLLCAVHTAPVSSVISPGSPLDTSEFSLKFFYGFVCFKTDN